MSLQDYSAGSFILRRRWRSSSSWLPTTPRPAKASVPGNEATSSGNRVAERCRNSHLDENCRPLPAARGPIGFESKDRSVAGGGGGARGASAPTTKETGNSI